MRGDIQRSSQLKIIDAKRQQQNVWTLWTCILAGALYWWPIEQYLGLTASSVVKTGSIALAGVCIFGSLFFIFQTPNSPR